MFKNLTNKKLKGGDVVRGEFRSRDNNMGGLLLRFNEFARVDFNLQDVLIIKIKEKNNPDWYYVKDYRTDMLRDTLLFPVGFPIIPSSKDKTYVFEIQSLYGNNTNSVSLSTTEPVLSTLHQTPRQYITKNPFSFLSYTIRKVFNSFSNIDFVLSSLVFSAPIVFYLLVLFDFKSTSKGAKSFIIPISTLFFVMLDILVLKNIFTGVLVILVALWLFSIRRNKLPSFVSFSTAFIFVFAWAMLVAFDFRKLDNKLNVWVYTFLLIGVIQLVFEEKNQKKIGGFKSLIKRFQIRK